MKEKAISHVSDHLSDRMRELYGPSGDNVKCLMADLSITPVNTTNLEGRLELRFAGGPGYKALVVVQEAKGMRNRKVLASNGRLEEQDC